MLVCTRTRRRPNRFGRTSARFRSRQLKPLQNSSKCLNRWAGNSRSHRRRRWFRRASQSICRRHCRQLQLRDALHKETAFHGRSPKRHRARFGRVNTGRRSRRHHRSRGQNQWCRNPMLYRPREPGSQHSRSIHIHTMAASPVRRSRNRSGRHLRRRVASQCPCNAQRFLEPSPNGPPPRHLSSLVSLSRISLAA